MLNEYTITIIFTTILTVHFLTMLTVFMLYLNNKDIVQHFYKNYTMLPIFGYMLLTYYIIPDITIDKQTIIIALITMLIYVPSSCIVWLKINDKHMYILAIAFPSLICAFTIMTQTTTTIVMYTAYMIISLMTISQIHKHTND